MECMLSNLKLRDFCLDWGAVSLTEHSRDCRQMFLNKDACCRLPADWVYLQFVTSAFVRLAIQRYEKVAGATNEHQADSLVYIC